MATGARSTACSSTSPAKRQTIWRRTSPRRASSARWPRSERPPTRSSNRSCPLLTEWVLLQHPYRCAGADAFLSSPPTSGDRRLRGTLGHRRPSAGCSRSARLMASYSVPSIARRGRSTRSPKASPRARPSSASASAANRNTAPSWSRHSTPYASSASVSRRSRRSERGYRRIRSACWRATSQRVYLALDNDKTGNESASNSVRRSLEPGPLP